MTRKHFAAIARVIESLELSDADRYTVAANFADMCGQFNPNFDRGRFLVACGVKR